MVSWHVVFTSRAKKDGKKLAGSGLKPQAEALLLILRDNPYQTPPPSRSWWENLREHVLGESISSIAWCTKF